MGSLVEQNDTLKISVERGFPVHLCLEEHVKRPFDADDFFGEIFKFRNAGIRRYNDQGVRAHLVQEMPDGKWLYWGDAQIIRQTQDSVTKQTYGEYWIQKIYTPEEQRIISNAQAPPGKSYFAT